MRKKSLLEYKIEPMTRIAPVVIGSASMRLALKCILWVYRLHAVLYSIQILSRKPHSVSSTLSCDFLNSTYLSQITVISAPRCSSLGCFNLPLSSSSMMQ